LKLALRAARQRGKQPFYFVCALAEREYATADIDIRPSFDLARNTSQDLRRLMLAPATKTCRNILVGVLRSEKFATG